LANRRKKGKKIVQSMMEKFFLTHQQHQISIEDPQASSNFEVMQSLTNAWDTRQRLFLVFDLTCLRKPL
jgi:hypothetical protein